MKITRRTVQRIVSTDNAVQRWVNAHQNQALKKIFAIISALGSGYLWLLLYSIIFIFGSDRPRSIVIAVVWAELLGLLIIILSRGSIKRERPIQNPVFFIPLPWQHGSFPSHHALRAAMLATIAGTLYPSSAPFLPLLVLTIPISRVYLNMHYFSDAWVGLIAGFLCGKSAILVILSRPR